MNPNIHLCQETIDLTAEIYAKYEGRIRRSILQTDKIDDVRTIDFPKAEYKELALSLIHI